MPTEAQVLAIDGCVTVRRKLCRQCGHPQPVDAFGFRDDSADGRRSSCQRCDRLSSHTYYHDRGGKEKRAEYVAREDVKQRYRERARRADIKQRWNELRRLRDATPRGKFVKARSNARFRLGQARTDERRAELQAVIEACDREIARLDREHELTAEPFDRVRLSSRAVRGSGSPFKGVYANRNGTYKVRVSIGGGEVRNGGTFATADEARNAANALAFQLIGVRDYAVPRAEARYATRRERA